MKVLVVGSGGREHTLVWKIEQSKKVDKIYCAPGNGGMRELAELVNIKPEDIDGILNFAKEKKIDLSLVGPEAPLVKGIVDRFTEAGLKIFGPTKELAMLEGSKVFAKETLKKFAVPTADFKVFDTPEKAKAYLKQKSAPIVVKADGIAAGKGVIVAKTMNEANYAVDTIMRDKIFGSSGDRVIIEDCLEGEEASILIFTDGKTIIPLESSQDHKRIYDGDSGPNTGGMGAYSPAPIVPKGMLDDIVKRVFMPVINGLKNEGKVYKGVLYAGLMLTKKGPMVLEFNVRFGDPETQAMLPRLKSDLVDAILACINGTLDKITLEWDDSACICVVCASKGYPGVYEKHKEIQGLEDVRKIQDIVVFHAGTSFENGKIFTSGGRVLGVTGLGRDIRSAKDRTYEALKKIKFEGMYYRRDIGDKAIKNTKS